MEPADSSHSVPGARLETLVGADLAALLEELPSPVESIEPITSLPSRNTLRASLRIHLRGGTILKGRRLATVFEAERLTRLTRHIGMPHVPAVIGQRGKAVMEPWTDGQPLNGRAVGPAVTSRCGALLAQIHLAPHPLDSENEIAVATDERRRRLTENVAKLIELGAIDRQLAARIHARAGAAPEGTIIGLIHGDFHDANLVETPDNRIVAIDNETLRFESLDYDLARTWYRWLMTPAEWQAFLSGYHGVRSTDGFLQHFSHWAICALVDSAVFRIGAQTDDAMMPLRRLSAFLNDEDNAAQAGPEPQR